MSKSKTPDTRNKLESVKVPTVKKKKSVKKKNFREIKDIMQDHSKESIKLKLTPKKTKGQLFKEKFGFSKSIARAMRRNGIIVPKTVEGYGIDVTIAIESYREVRKKKKKILKKKQQDKRSFNKANRVAIRATKKKK